MSDHDQDASLLDLLHTLDCHVAIAARGVYVNWPVHPVAVEPSEELERSICLQSDEMRLILEGRRKYRDYQRRIQRIKQQGEKGD